MIAFFIITFLAVVDAAKIYSRETYMKIAAFKIASNIAVTTMGNQWDLKKVVKAKAHKLKHQHNIENKPTRQWRYYLHSAIELLGGINWNELDAIVQNKKSYITKSLKQEEVELSLTESLIDTYYFFHIHENEKVLFFSQWENWDQLGYELRSPRKINSKLFLDVIRGEFGSKAYVIESFSQMLKWRYIWKGSALVSASLLGELTPELLKTQRAFNLKKLSSTDFDLIRNTKRKKIGSTQEVSEAI